MSTPFRTPRRIGATSGLPTLRQPAAAPLGPADCAHEPGGMTYRQAREILRVHEVHGPRCRQWLAAAAYLSAGLDDE